MHAAATGNSGLDNFSRIRDMKYNEALYEFMAKQFELAKIDEAKDPAMIQVLDRAVVPERKSKPKRTLIVLVATVAALLFAILLAFIREALVRARTGAAAQGKLQLLNHYLRGGAARGR